VCANQTEEEGANLMKETLVIVHLSSIDNYIDFYGIDAAIQFVTDLKMAIVTGYPTVQTVIMDQEWDEISDEAFALRYSVLELQNFYPITLFHHDELCDISPWQEGMKKLAKLLREMETSRVRLGGLWAKARGATGCVHEVQRCLRARNIPCSIDSSLIALEENDTRALLYE
jgi:hypothetical protein